MIKKILELIETVDPNDTAKLDEIDARVWCFIEQEEYVGTVNETHMFRGKHSNGLDVGFRVGYCFLDHPEVPKYTRSRDALKAIRPEGCSISAWFDVIKKEAQGTVLMFSDNRGKMSSPVLPTEELAELHAIIQAIEWERKNEG